MQSYWTQRGFDAHGRRDNPSEKGLCSHNVAGLKKKWEFASGGAIVSGIAITHEHVFFGNFLNKVFAVHRTTGSLAWEFTTGAFIDSSPACHEGVLFIGSNDGNVYALHTATGSIKWQTTIGGVRFSSATLSDGHLYIGGQAAVSKLRQSGWRNPVVTTDIRDHSLITRHR